METLTNFSVAARGDDVSHITLLRILIDWCHIVAIVLDGLLLGKEHMIFFMWLNEVSVANLIKFTAIDNSRIQQLLTRVVQVRWPLRVVFLEG